MYERLTWLGLFLLPYFSIRYNFEELACQMIDPIKHFCLERLDYFALLILCAYKWLRESATVSVYRAIMVAVRLAPSKEGRILNEPARFNTKFSLYLIASSLQPLILDSGVFTAALPRNRENWVAALLCRKLVLPVCTILDQSGILTSFKTTTTNVYAIATDVTQDMNWHERFFNRALYTTIR